MRKLIFLVSVLVILTGCRDQQSDEPESELKAQTTARPSEPATTIRETAAPTATPTPSPTATVTSTPTPTPTPSPTATPAAQLISATGDPRAASLHAAVSQDGPLCGLVDVFDFPLNPPEGDGAARGGGDYGTYRGRYDKYHAGEDWWMNPWRSSFGTPVYSIGHGRVTYAAPNGWGRDQGVVIVRHTFADGRQLLSFYGHLHPESVTLRNGDCVRRGEQVGTIGRPTTGPHLHFEIRTHMPGEPGTGYWWEDPTLAGWKPPSATIWQERMSASPGVEWLRAPADRGSEGVGVQDGHTYILLEGRKVVGLDVTDGSLRWSLESEDSIDEAMLDSVRPFLYVADRIGQVQAFRLPELDSPEFESTSEGGSELAWQFGLDMVGRPAMIPLPGGGLIVIVRDTMTALSASGRLLWQAEDFGRLLDWTIVGDQLLLSTLGSDYSLWTIDEVGPSRWEGLSGGLLAGQENEGLLFNGSGLFRLDPADGSVDFLTEWPQDTLLGGDVLALRDGRILLAHANWSERRLIFLGADGALIWQRALPRTIAGNLSLLLASDRPYLVVQEDSGISGSLSVFAIDTEAIALTRLFSGGTRSPLAHSGSVHPAGDERLLINIGGGHLVALDLGSAARRIASAAESTGQ